MQAGTANCSAKSASPHEVAELRKKVAKLEENFQRACSIAGEAQARVQLLEGLIDSKRDAVDSNRESELQIRLNQLTKELEAERKDRVKDRTRIVELSCQLAFYEEKQQEQLRKPQTGEVASQTDEVQVLQKGPLESAEMREKAVPQNVSAAAANAAPLPVSAAAATAKLPNDSVRETRNPAIPDPIIVSKIKAMGHIDSGIKREINSCKEEEMEDDEHDPFPFAALSPLRNSENREGDNINPNGKQQSHSNIPSEEHGDTVVREKTNAQRKQPNIKDAWKFSYPDWMREVKRRRFPYVAQIGDQVVYFRQGYEVYLCAVDAANLYPIDPTMEPTHEIGMEEFAVVEDVKYIRTPYRLTTLKLARTDSEGKRTGHTWKIKFHDMDNVADFIILKAFYDEGLAMDLKAGDKIAADLEGVWMAGTVECTNRNKSYPNALWQSVGVRWSDGEEYALSPWDLKKNVDGRRSGQPVSDDEATQMGTVIYNNGDWPEGDENGEATRRRMKGILESLAKCEANMDFANPVDVIHYRDYPAKVAFPIDIHTISERIENQYYRRLRSLLQDVRHVALATETYNVKNAPIVLNAKVLVEAVCRLANDPSIEDVVSFYDSCFELPENELVEYKRRPGSEVNTEMLEILRAEERKRGNDAHTAGWATDAVKILEELMQHLCAQHFVNKDESSEELAAVWSDPSCQDLQTLVEKVRVGEMATPKEIESAVHHLVNTTTSAIESRRNRIFKGAVKMEYLFDRRFEKVLTKFDNMQESLESQIRTLVDRILGRRDRDAPHEYNTTRKRLRHMSEEEEEGQRRKSRKVIRTSLSSHCSQLKNT